MPLHVLSVASLTLVLCGVHEKVSSLAFSITCSAYLVAQRLAVPMWLWASGVLLLLPPLLLDEVRRSVSAQSKASLACVEMLRCGCSRCCRNEARR